MCVGWIVDWRFQQRLERRLERDFDWILRFTSIQGVSNTQKKPILNATLKDAIRTVLSRVGEAKLS